MGKVRKGLEVEDRAEEGMGGREERRREREGEDGLYGEIER